MQLFGKILYFFKKLYPNTDNTINVFNHYFFDLKYYLKPLVSDHDFAQLMNITVEKLNSISIHCHSLSFEMLLNETRYKHILEELQNPINADLPIKSIVYTCGFEDNINFLSFMNKKNSNVFKNFNI